jgi:hypothetical protein
VLNCRRQYHIVFMYTVIVRLQNVIYVNAYWKVSLNKDTGVKVLYLIKFFWRILKRSSFLDCKMSVHKKCIPKVTKNCRGTPMQNSTHGKKDIWIGKRAKILLNRWWGFITWTNWLFSCCWTITRFISIANKSPSRWRRWDRNFSSWKCSCTTSYSKYKTY